MPHPVTPARAGGRRTLTERTGTEHTAVVVESADAGASVDIPVATFTGAFGFYPSRAQFENDFSVSRTDIAEAGDEAANTIAIARVAHETTKVVVHFTAAAAGGKRVGVRVTRR